MPSVSEAQRCAAGLALAAKTGHISPKTLKGPARSMYESMSIEELREFARKPKKAMPAHK